MLAAQTATAASADPEQPLWHGRYSAKAMYGIWLLAALVTVGAAVTSAIVPTPLTWIVAGGVTGVLWLVSIIYYLKEWLGASYTLTSQRLIHKEGILRQVANRIEAIDIDDVTYAQGIIQRMLDVGTIKITSSDKSHPELALKGIDEVQRVADLIDNARREERRKRGLHMEVV